MNLRKDHCRNLQSRTTREPLSKTTTGRGRAAGPSRSLPRTRPTNKTPARDAPRNQKRKDRERAARRVPETDLSRAALSPSETKRLSATDISALASMKNVAKCDTWCELQNPVNHRVFERKLRPKPSGQGHVCLGVMHRRPPILPSPPRGKGVRGGRRLVSRALPLAVGRNTSCWRPRAPRQAVVVKDLRRLPPARLSRGSGTLFSNHSDPRSGGITR